VPAPSQSLLQRWLRETHNIIVVCIPSSSRDDMKITGYQYDIYVNARHKNTSKDFHNYELTLESGLKSALKLIK